MALSKKHTKVLRRAGMMWHVRPTSVGHRGMIEMWVCDTESVNIDPSVAIALGKALIETAKCMLEKSE